VQQTNVPPLAAIRPAANRDGYPPVPDNLAWLEKYGEAIDAQFGSATKFAERFSIPVRIHLTHVRGF